MAVKKMGASKQPTARRVKEIILEIENTQGKLAEVLGVLAERKINLLAYSTLSLQRVGVLHILPDSAPKALKALERTDATRVSVSDIVYAVCPDKVGGGAAVTRRISEAGIDIHYSYATSAGGRKYGAVFQTADNAKVVRLLNRR
jgi:hypothetical protein